MSKYQHGIRKVDVNSVLVNSVGVVSSSDVISAIRPGKTVLVTLILANNESVALQPMENVVVHCR